MTLPGLPRVTTRWIVLLCIYTLVASASYCGFFAKYALRDDSDSDAMTQMLDGTADRPYVYRQLLPGTANLLEAALPRGVKQRLLTHLQEEYPKHNWLRNTFARATDAAKPQYALRYYMVYAMTFSALLGAMLILRLVCLHLIGNEVAATLAPLAFALAVPAGNFWDFPELFFMTLAVWVALRARLFWLLPLTLVATLNKESFLFFLIALYPFVSMRVSRSRTLAWLGTCMVLAAAVNFATKLHYAGNPGDLAQFHLWDNVRFLADPRNYLHGEPTYGILLPKGFNILLLFVAFVVARAGWSALPPAARQHALLVCAINIPLYLLFGYLDEIRALSMVDVSAALLICAGVAGYVSRAMEPAPVPVTKRQAVLQQAHAQPALDLTTDS
jgi:hypothetical protein